MKKPSLTAWVACSAVLHGLLLLLGWLVFNAALGSRRTEIIGQIITAEIFQQDKAEPAPAAAEGRPALEVPAKPAIKPSARKVGSLQPPPVPCAPDDHPGTAAQPGALEAGETGHKMPPESKTSISNDVAVLSSEGSASAGKVVAGQPAGQKAEIVSKIHGIVSKSVIYPPAALRSGIQGVVKVAFRIGQDGKPVDIRVEGTSGYSILDEAAVEAVEKGKAYPLIAKTVVIPVRFSLK